MIMFVYISFRDSKVCVKFYLYNVLIQLLLNQEDLLKSFISFEVSDILYLSS